MSGWLSVSYFYLFTCVEFSGNDGAGEALFKEAVPFPGDTKVWMAFREWLYREMNVKVEVEFKAVLEMDEATDVEDDGQWPKSGEGLEDRYADGEDEDTDGGVRLVWA